MHKITLVCSGHRESGRCNAEELLEILRAIGPEVVFEEIRPSEFDYYYGRGSVEAHAITRYRKFKPFQQVPVDRYDVPENLAEIKKQFDCVLDYVDEASPEYRLLNRENDKSVYQNGFGYLNSVDCATIMESLSEIEEQTINATDDQILIRRLQKWRHLMQRREREMVGNIYEYCRENVFDTGVFLVGAAHKSTIIKEIEKYGDTEADLINWNFAYRDPSGGMK